MDALSKAHLELSKEQKTWKILEQGIETLSKLRNHKSTAGNSNQGLVLLDQFFTVPQIGEVIRDLLVMSHLAQSIEKQQ